jgi:SAM-dependent methyltransferase
VINWFPEFDRYVAAVERIRPRAHAIESVLEKHETVRGYCSNCENLMDFQVNVGAWLGQHSNLRDGLRCNGCGMNNRGRFLLDAVLDSTPAPDNARMALLEAYGPFHDSIARRFPILACSEFFGRDKVAGELQDYRDRKVAHQDATRLSYADASFDVFCHNDVLEHIYDYRLALKEMRRVTRAGGTLIFGVPFFYDLDKTQVRGIEKADGSITHLEEPEYHGDGVRTNGIYTFYHYGRDLLDAIKLAGFTSVELGLSYDVFFGYVSNNHRYGGHGFMLPTVFRAR